MKSLRRCYVCVSRKKPFMFSLNIDYFIISPYNVFYTQSENNDGDARSSQFARSMAMDNAKRIWFSFSVRSVECLCAFKMHNNKSVTLLDKFLFDHRSARANRRSHVAAAPCCHKWNFRIEPEQVEFIAFRPSQLLWEMLGVRKASVQIFNAYKSCRIFENNNNALNGK